MSIAALLKGREYGRYSSTTVGQAFPDVFVPVGPAFADKGCASSALGDISRNANTSARVCIDENSIGLPVVPLNIDVIHVSRLHALSFLDLQGDPRYRYQQEGGMR